MIATSSPDTRPPALSPPGPSPRHYATLGVRHGETVAQCVAAFARLDRHYDPRRHPESQRWAIIRQNEIDEALALIVDAERLAGAVGR